MGHARGFPINNCLMLYPYSKWKMDPSNLEVSLNLVGNSPGSMSMEEKVVTAQVQSNSSFFYLSCRLGTEKKQAKKNPKLLLKGPSEP